jgi:hypothetical protein
MVMEWQEEQLRANTGFTQQVTLEQKTLLIGRLPVVPSQTHRCVVFFALLLIAFQSSQELWHSVVPCYCGSIGRFSSYQVRFTEQHPSRSISKLQILHVRFTGHLKST